MPTDYLQEMKKQYQVHVDNHQFYFETPIGWGTLPVTHRQANFAMDYIRIRGETITFTGEYLGWLISRLHQNIVDD